MSLLTLPIEVLAMIVQQLDTKSLFNLYDACEHIRNVICMPGVVKDCEFFLNTLATAKSLKLDFFKDIGGHIRTLNLSGVMDLSKTSLIPALKRLISLVELDVSHTKIQISDYLDIVKVRPMLKSLAINYSFGKGGLTRDSLSNYQQAFKDLTNVHFVVTLNDILFGNVPILLLTKAELFSLEFTIYGTDYIYGYNDFSDLERLFKIAQIKIHFMSQVKNRPILKNPLFELLDLSNYEIIIFYIPKRNSFYATPMLKELISEQFKVSALALQEIPNVDSHVTIMLWNRALTKFDGKFYSQLLTILKEYLIFNLDSNNTVRDEFKWYRIEQSCQSLDKNDVKEVSKFKKKRLAQPSLVLNYNDVFKDMNDIKLEVEFIEPLTRPVTLDNGRFLKKISHLSLVGNVQYTSDFFKILFEGCDSLVTLQIVKPEGNFSVPTFLNVLPKSKCLKNVLIHIRVIHYVPLFSYFCECKTLENIFLINSSSIVCSLPNPTDLFSKCVNLYSLIIMSDMLNTKKTLSLYTKVRSKLGKDYLNIGMVPYTDVDIRNIHNPYISVFNV